MKNNLNSIEFKDDLLKNFHKRIHRIIYIHLDILIYPKKLGSGIPLTPGLTANKPPEYLFSPFDLSSLVEIDVM